MLIALRHELHGVHIAYSDLEANECEKGGWKRDNELSLELAGRAPAPKKAVESATEEPEPKRGPGRPKKTE